MRITARNGLGLFLGILAIGGWFTLASAADKDQPKPEAKKPAAAAKDAGDNNAKPKADRPEPRQSSDKAPKSDRANDDADRSRPNVPDRQAGQNPRPADDDRVPARTRPDDADDRQAPDRKVAEPQTGKQRDTDRDADRDQRPQADREGQGPVRHQVNRPDSTRTAGAGDRDRDRDRDRTNVGARATFSKQQTARLGLQFGAATSGSGLVISSIGPNTFFANVGFRPNDQIIAVGGRRFTSRDAFYQYLTTVEPRQRVPFVVLRDGQEQTLYWTPTQEFVDEFAQAAPSGDANFLGIYLDDQVQDAAVVAEVEANSPAQRAGVRRNDVIVAVNDQEVRGPADFEDATAQLPRGSNVDLSVSRTINLHITQGNAQQGTGATQQPIAQPAPPQPIAQPVPQPQPVVVPAPGPRPVVVPAQPQPQPRRGPFRRGER